METRVLPQVRSQSHRPRRRRACLHEVNLRVPSPLPYRPLLWVPTSWATAVRTRSLAQMGKRRYWQPCGRCDHPTSTAITIWRGGRGGPPWPVPRPSPKSTTVPACLVGVHRRPWATKRWAFRGDTHASSAASLSRVRQGDAPRRRASLRTCWARSPPPLQLTEPGARPSAPSGVPGPWFWAAIALWRIGLPIVAQSRRTGLAGRGGRGARVESRP